MLDDLPAGIASEGEAIERCAAAFCPSVALDVAGHCVEAAVCADELSLFYVPFCCSLLARSQRASRGRLLVGIAGPPGSGKSVLAALLAGMIETLARRPLAVVIPMDGFHFTNDYLVTHAAADGTPMKRIKGAPETFDVKALAAALKRVATEPRVDLPRYDRGLHDPVQGGIAVGPHHGIALVEGNYLLLDRPGWREVTALLDVRLFIDMAPDAAREGLIARHVRGGRTREDAERHHRAVDVPNHDLCITQRDRADLVVTRGADQHVMSATRNTADER